MKIHVNYLVTMGDSPTITDVSAFVDKQVAKTNLASLRKEAKEFNDEAEEEDSSDWCQARCSTTEKGEGMAKPGDTVFVVIETNWLEVVETKAKPFYFENFAKEYIAKRKKKFHGDNPKLVPFYEDENFDETLHLCDDSLMQDVYFEIQKVTIR